MLNNNGKSGHLCRVPDLKEKAFSFSPLTMIFSVGFSYMIFNEIEERKLYPYTLKCFN